MKEAIIEWQLPVTDDVLNGTGYRIHGNSKIHCFVNGLSLCNPKQLWMVPESFKTTYYGAKDIDNHPEYFCKKCVEKYKKFNDNGRQ